MVESFESSKRMRFYWLILGILGVWRVTHLLHAEDGPWNLLVKFRRSLGSGLLGQLLDCFYCLSLWIAIPFAWVIGQSWKERLLLWPALSGAAILLHRARAITSESEPPAMYLEDKEPTDVLRQESDSASLRQECRPPPVERFRLHQRSPAGSVLASHTSNTPGKAR